MPRHTQNWAVIPAAGVGARVGGATPKQYRQLQGRTILEHTLALFCDHPGIAGVMVAIAEGDAFWPKLAISSHQRVMTATGGRERYHSVLNCLGALNGIAAPDDWVLVHDAARPCVRRSDVDALIEAAGAHPVGGILALPVRDTMKRGEGLEIRETVNREGLWHALTPQMFRLQDLHQALADAVEAGVALTDEAQAMERSGARPLLIPGHADNIKITDPDDLIIAELLLGLERGRI